MNILDRFRTEQPASDWYWDRRIVQNAGTHVGGPSQVGPSRLIRLRNDSAPCSVIDLIIYVTAQNGEYRLDLLVQWSVFDARTLEVTWSGSRTWAGPATTSSLVIAGSAVCCDAYEMASGYAGLVTALNRFGQDTFGPVLGWDGQPFEQDGEER